ncbi:FKBP-type peptidyl-prolyl cis-trans isomerase [Sphingomonas sanxanigenens]|uniref:Peptidyl-prolyl cis-trans isomerase n=1 Tax=Sphingomonas sanxanigenens DSM 19645 = NX02 TaxID=1123269 RepID=W0ANP2_9SPHN|nr:FKBP-type peptidyl-prolyl cis-trans isomerase [Sphingomonas sanxanigenens]AHE57355.1 hypothetical protein NX02_28930 [Sphingomonas sanxanigenens DSM 19645 = NX02]
MSSVTAVPLRPIAKGSLTKLWVGVAALVLVAGGLAYVGEYKLGANATPEQFMAWNAGQDGVVTTESGLQYKILKPGSGPTPTDEDVVTIAYKGSLRDGTEFDKAPSIQLPVAQMVPGFSEALKLMPRGSKFQLWLPPKLGYGEQSPSPQIPPNSVLVFEVDMLQFASIAELRRQMMMGGGGGMGGAGGAPDMGGAGDPRAGQ